MESKYLTEEVINGFIKSAIAEDVGDGDHSSLAAIPISLNGTAKLLIKDDGIIAGAELSKKIFHTIDPSLEVDISISDGAKVKKGDIAFIVKGHVRSILTAERLVLNYMQRMSGIATYTRRLVDLIAGTGAKLLDTRKTTPNLRVMEKWAVSIGGGHNHRFGLFDMIMLKDNHVDYGGGIQKTIAATHQYLKQTGKPLRIEVETRTLEEVREVMAVGGIDVIMLDNMSPATMKEAVRIIDHKFETEASGGITEQTIREIAETGVDFISVGALTHSVTSLDMSLKAQLM